MNHFVTEMNGLIENGDDDDMIQHQYNILCCAAGPFVSSGQSSKYTRVIDVWEIVAYTTDLYVKQNNDREHLHNTYAIV